MKVILYHGIDQIFFDEVSAAAKTIPQCIAFRREGSVSTLITEAFDLKPHIIVIDASYAELLSEEIRILKSVSEFRPVLIAAYCKDEQEVKASQLLIPSGVHLFHLKDTDSETFFRDCFRYAFNTKYPEAEFAKARNLETTLSLGFISHLTSVTKMSCEIETDLKLEGELTALLPVNGGTSELTLEVKEVSEAPSTVPYLRTYRLSWPYPGPWDEVGENSLSQDTVETWMELRKNSFDPRKLHLGIFTQDENLLKHLLKSPPAFWYQIFRSADESLSRLSFTKPGVIFYDLQGKEGPDLNHVAEVVRLLREISPSPMLVITGTKSDSSALRKLFDYEFLLSFPGPLSYGMFSAMAKKFLEKAQIPDEKFYLRATDPERNIRITRAVTLTSITERELTFILDEELPYFTVAETALPIPMFLTIVPAEGQLPSTKKGRHYKAIIHGLSEESLTKLRKIVNQLIYDPLQKLTQESVEIMLKQDYIQKVVEASRALEARATAVPQESHPERFTVIRDLRGKSKL